MKGATDGTWKNIHSLTQYLLSQKQKMGEFRMFGIPIGVLRGGKNKKAGASSACFIKTVFALFGPYQFEAARDASFSLEFISR